MKKKIGSLAVQFLFWCIFFHGIGASAQTVKTVPFLQTLEPYKPIFALNSWFLNNEGTEQGFYDNEVILQLSFKKQILGPVYFGYTQKGHWQIMNYARSRSFRDQNYNPELFLQFTDVFSINQVRIGIDEHESNGDRTRYDKHGNEVNDSRTWDRSYLFLQKQIWDVFAIGVKAWVVTSPKRDQWQSFYDDNPDMQQYLGSGEIYFTLGDKPMQVVTMLRHGWKSGTETLRIDANLPIFFLFGEKDSGIDLYCQYFAGYGDTLLDYNRKITRFALGISFR